MGRYGMLSEKAHSCLIFEKNEFKVVIVRLAKGHPLNNGRWSCDIRSFIKNLVMLSGTFIHRVNCLNSISYWECLNCLLTCFQVIWIVFLMSAQKTCMPSLALNFSQVENINFSQTKHIFLPNIHERFQQQLLNRLTQFAMHPCTH